jgi:ribonuclease T2
MPGAEVKPGLLAAALAAAISVAGPAAADDRAGDFDFYVLSLSWSPSWCEAEGEDDHPQCDGRRPYAFVLHGVWPQWERGFPAYCAGGPSGEPSRSDVARLLDIMPSPGLVRHQWRKHGTCSGLDAGDYVELLEDAYSLVAIPRDYRRLESPLMVSPREVERAFVAANPGLAADGIAVTCDSRRVREVRICLTDDLEFRPCPEIDRRGCSVPRVVMPPVR